MVQPLEDIRTRIAHAARIAGRQADAVTLVAVSKTHPAEAIVPLIAAGQRVFGENRVQELLEKLQAQGVVCASCREVCPASAIRVPPGARGAATVDPETCTGCGACVAPCPVDAIALHHASAMEALA